METCVKDPGHQCIGAAKAAVLEHRIEALEEWQQSSKTFHNNFYNWQREEIAWKARLEEQLKTISTNTDKALAYQETQQQKPGKFIDKMKENIAWAFIGAFLVFILTKVGL